MENKDNLISRKYLYDKIAELEEDVRKTIVHQPKGSPEYLRCQSRLNELNEFKSEVRDAPTVTDTNVGSKWIPCSERLPEDEREVLITLFGDSIYLGWYDLTDKQWCTEEFDCEEGEVSAWMPLPEPYKGE